MAKYVSPTYERIQNPASKGNFFVRLAYGVVGSYMDTKSMTTREVIEEFLKRNGVRTPAQFFKEKFKGRNGPEDKKDPPKTDLPKENKKEPLKRESFAEAKVKMINNTERIGYGRIITKKKLEANIDLGQNGMGELTTHLFNEDSFGMRASTGDGAYFTRTGNFSAWKMDSFTDKDSTYHELGETFYHESWHAIDNNYGNVNWTNFRGMPESNIYMSTSHKLSTGKTFMSTLLEEYSRASVDAMREEIKADIDLYFKEKYGFTRQEIVKKYGELADESERLYREWMFAERKAETERASADDVRIAKEKYYEHKNTDEYKKFLKANTETRTQYPPKVMKKWASMSDVVNGATSGRETLVNVGHFSIGYWNDESRAKEAFAEIAGAKATNPANYECIKKYLPQTVKAFEEIYDGLLSGKIKTRGRFKG